MRIVQNEYTANASKDKAYYEIKVISLKHVKETFMFYLKNITTLKELEKNRTT